MFSTNRLVESIGDCVPTMGLQRLTGKRVIFLDGSEDLEPFGGWGVIDSELKPRYFAPKENQRIVASIDSSTVHIAETEEGSIFGAKAGIAFSVFGRIAGYYKLGPLLVYLDANDIKKLAEDCVAKVRLFKLLMLDTSVVQRTIRTRIERTLVLEMASSLQGSILLLDGSLGPSPFESPTMKLRDIIKMAHEKDNCVHGVSKTSNIRILRRLFDCLRGVRPPAYLDVDEIVRATLRMVYGRILLVRFSGPSIPLRVDVCPPTSEDFENSLAQVAYSDTFYHGYHESLRLAHYLSIFSFDELSSIKGYLIKNLSAVETKGTSPREFILES